MSPFFIAAVMTAASATAAAQGSSAPAPTIEYRSAFEGYRGWSTQPPRDWRQVNDEVERLGGHAGHLRASPGASDRGQPASPAAKAAAPMPQSQGHHGSPASEPRR